MNGLLVGATIALALFALIQIFIMRDFNKRSLRAYVLPVAAIRCVEDGVSQLKITVRNSGKTPASECIMETIDAVGPLTKPLPSLPDISKERERTMRSVSFLGGGDETWIFDDATDISAQNAEAIRRNDGAHYIIGTITYKDVFGENHTTLYRFLSHGNNFDKGMYVFSDEGNSTDTD